MSRSGRVSRRMMVRLGHGAALAALVTAGVLLPGATGRATGAEGPVTTALAAASAAVRSPTGSYLAGRYAQHVDDWKSAADFMAQAMAADPRDVNLARRTFILMLGEGRIAAALPLAQRLAGKVSDGQLAAVLLVADDLAAGRHDPAEARLKAMPTEGLAQYVGPLLAAWVKAARGDSKAALEALAPIAKTPGFAALHDLHAGLIDELAGNTEAAARRYATVAEGGAPLRVVQVVGNFLERTGRLDAARALYTGYRDANADSPMVEPTLRRLDTEGPSRVPVVATARDGMAEALFDLASALHQEGAEEVGLLYTRIALHLRPDFPLARLMLGDMLAARGNHADALEQYRAVEASPTLSWAARLRAVDSLGRLERNEEAIALLAAMVDELPDRFDALTRLGDLYRGAKRYADAAVAYDKALSRVDAIEDRHWSLFYARGMANERSDNWEKAEADLLRAVAMNPSQPYLLNYLGYSWVDRGLNLEKARAMIERAVELRPNDGFIADSLGWVLFRLGDPAAAVTRLERAVELRPLDSTINDHLGDVYWAVGRRAEARFQWQRALINAEEDEQTAAIRAKLERGGPAARQAADAAAPAVPH